MPHYLQKGIKIYMLCDADSGFCVDMLVAAPFEVYGNDENYATVDVIVELLKRSNLLDRGFVETVKFNDLWSLPY